ncbi:hypothetical protein [Caballeronia sp. M23-90]
MRRSAENKLIVVAVRIDPQIEQRLRLLAETTGRKQSFFSAADDRARDRRHRRNLVAARNA